MIAQLYSGIARTLEAYLLNEYRLGYYVVGDKESGPKIPYICKVAEAYGFKTCCIDYDMELYKALLEVMKDDASILCMCRRR